MPDANHDEQVNDMLDHFYADEPTAENGVTNAVQDRVADFIQTDDYDDDTIIGIWELYNTYVSQLRAICADHTLSHTRSAMLTEEEAVVSDTISVYEDVMDPHATCRRWEPLLPNVLNLGSGRTSCRK